MQTQHKAGLDRLPPEQEGERAEMPLNQLFLAFWRARRLVTTIVISSFVLTLYYATCIRTPEYVAAAMVGPIDAGGSGASVKQAVAAYAGIDLGGMSSGNFTKFTQLLHSTRLADVLQRKYGLMAVAYPGQWDEVTHQWKKPSGPTAALKAGLKSVLGLPPWSAPTPSAFAGFLTKTINIQRVAGSTPLDLKNQTTAISVKLSDRDDALRFLQLALREADDICRQDQLTNTERRISYLTKLIAQTQEIYLKQSLQQLLMGEEQTLITVRANRYYSLDMIDTPNADTIPAGTRVMVLLMEGTAAGFFASLGLVFLLFRRRFLAAQNVGGGPLAEPFPDPVGAAIRWISAQYGRLRRARHRLLPGE